MSCRPEKIYFHGKICDGESCDNNYKSTSLMSDVGFERVL